MNLSKNSKIITINEEKLQKISISDLISSQIIEDCISSTVYSSKTYTINLLKCKALTKKLKKSILSENEEEKLILYVKNILENSHNGEEMVEAMHLLHRISLNTRNYRPILDILMICSNNSYLKQNISKIIRSINEKQKISDFSEYKDLLVYIKGELDKENVSKHLQLFFNDFSRNIIPIEKFNVFKFASFEEYQHYIPKEYNFFSVQNVKKLLTFVNKKEIERIKMNLDRSDPLNLFLNKPFANKEFRTSKKQKYSSFVESKNTEFSSEKIENCLNAESNLEIPKIPLLSKNIQRKNLDFISKSDPNHLKLHEANHFSLNPRKDTLSSDLKFNELFDKSIWFPSNFQLDNLNYETKNSENTKYNKSEKFVKIYSILSEDEKNADDGFGVGTKKFMPKSQEEPFLAFEKIPQTNIITDFSKMKVSKNRTDETYLSKTHLLTANSSSIMNFSTHFCDFIRIEYLNHIDNIESLISFVRFNQFVDSMNLQITYIEYFNRFIFNFVQNNENALDNSQIYQLNKIVVLMCQSKVEIRKRLGLEIFSILNKYFLTLKSLNVDKILFTLCFDGFKDIREMAIKNINIPDINTNFINKKLTSYEYSDIYGITDMVKKMDNKDTLVYNISKIFKDKIIKINSVEYMEKNNVVLHGYIYFLSNFAVEIDEEIRKIYNLAYQRMKHLYNNQGVSYLEEDTNDFDVLMWRNLHEIMNFYSNKSCCLADLNPIFNIMLEIRHLGLFSYGYKILSERLSRLNLDFNDQKTFLLSILNQITDDYKNLTRAGSGIPLIFLSFLSVNQNRLDFIPWITIHLIESIQANSSTILQNIYLQIIIQFFSDHRSYDSFLQHVLLIAELALDKANSENWKIKNAGVFLFSKILSFAFSKKSKKYFNSQKHGIFIKLRKLILEKCTNSENDTVIYLGLIFFKRCASLEDHELLFLNKCYMKEELIKLNAAKLLGKVKYFFNDLSHESRNIEENTDLPVKYIPKMLFIFQLLDSSRKIFQRRGCELMKKNGYPLASFEYNKYLLVKDAILKNYIIDLQKNMNKNSLYISKHSFFSDEISSEYPDYQYNIELIEFCRKEIEEENCVLKNSQFNID